MKDSIEIPIPEMQQSSEFEIKNLKKNLNPKSKSINRIKTFNYNNNNDENDIVNQRTFSKRKKSSTPNKFFSSSSNNFFKSKLQNINNIKKNILNLSSDF